MQVRGQDRRNRTKEGDLGKVGGHMQGSDAREQTWKVAAGVYCPLGKTSGYWVPSLSKLSACCWVPWVTPCKPQGRCAWGNRISVHTEGTLGGRAGKSSGRGVRNSCLPVLCCLAFLRSTSIGRAVISQQ
jgi:hypothetical protein